MTSSSIKKFLISISISLISFLVFILTLELFFYFLEPSEKISCQSCRAYTKHPIYGQWNRPNFSHEAVKSCGSDPCYHVRYTYDQFGRRTTGIEKKSKKHILLLGCSYAFGEGLNDSDTLAYKLQSQSEARLYNYSRPAASASHALAVLESNDIENEISEKQGTAVYILLDFHSQRESLSTFRPWSWTSPAYELDSQGVAHFVGTQAESQPFLYRFFSVYVWLKKKSYFLSYLNRNFDSKSEIENENLLAGLLKKAKKIYEKKFNGRFIVISHPKSSKISPSIIDALRKAEIPFFQIADFDGPKEQSNVCRCDFHPTGAVNNHLAEKIKSILQQSDHQPVTNQK